MLPHHRAARPRRVLSRSVDSRPFSFIIRDGFTRAALPLADDGVGAILHGRNGDLSNAARSPDDSRRAQKHLRAERAPVCERQRIIKGIGDAQTSRAAKVGGRSESAANDGHRRSATGVRCHYVGAKNLPDGEGRSRGAHLMDRRRTDVGSDRCGSDGESGRVGCRRQRHGKFSC